jgi:protoheme IX farnesyltransferase
MSAAISVKRIANRQAYSWSELAILLLSLGKIRISLLVVLSTATGYLLAVEEVTIRMLVPAAAVFLLAYGSCALNQFQERKTDALMERTKNRPLPSGKLNSSSALFISLGLISVGSFTLFRGASLLTGVLGLFAIFWYNGIYTYLKRKTAFASIPGALIGAIPPALGWVSGGGSLLDPRIWAVVFFFFMWQVPHFWLLLLDFGKDYENAGFPSLTQVFNSAQLRRMTFVWIFATAVTCMIIPLFGIVKSHVINGGLFVAGFWLVWKTFRILTTQSQEFPFRFNFKVINTYILMVIFLFAMDHLIR